jgi:hypothetical protein
MARYDRATSSSDLLSFVASISFRKPIAGTRLIREWKGIEHCVTVRQDDFEYQGRPYKSLSAIARNVTGTRWNGLVFFGLKNTRSRT